MSSFQGVLIRGVPAVLFIEVTSFQGADSSQYVYNNMLLIENSMLHVPIDMRNVQCHVHVHVFSHEEYMGCMEVHPLYSDVYINVHVCTNEVCCIYVHVHV